MWGAVFCLCGGSGWPAAAQTAPPPAALSAPAGVPATPAGALLPRQTVFRKAAGTRPWQFPRDHGQHPAYLLEWWYYTGVVATEEGREFGYQVTFFRKGLRRPVARTSAWAAGSMFAAHGAVSDVAGGRHWHQAAVGREALGMSGADPDRHRVWLGPWRAEPLAGDPHGVNLRLAARKFALALRLTAAGPPVLHGEGGLHQKGPLPGEASWYYSLPHMATEGTVTLGGRVFRVRGFSWMDHEFGTNQLAPDQVGWDWFGLRLAGGGELMLYRLRLAGGGSHAFSGGTWIAPDGATTPITLADAPLRPPEQPTQPRGAASIPARMTPTAQWHSPASGGAYPIGWEISLPEKGLRLQVRAAFAAQELLASPGVPFPYWEGMVRVSGTSPAGPVTGEGYMELTGYAQPLGDFFR